MPKHRLPNYLPPPPPASCPVSGKNQYTSEAEALQAAEYQEKLGSVSLGVYRCGYCDTWHLTSNPPDGG